MQRASLAAALVLSALVVLGASNARGAPDEGAVTLEGGVLTIERDRVRLAVDDEGGLLLRWPGGEQRLAPAALRGLREVRAAGALHVSGRLHTATALTLRAEHLLIGGSVRAGAVALEAEGLLEVEQAGRVTSRGGAVELRSGRLSLVGEVDAAGGAVSVHTQRLLHAGPIRSPGGRVELRCERYIATRAGAISTADPAGEGGPIEVLASERLFSSGCYRATGRRGGRVWLSGAEVRLVAATVDASGGSGGAIWVGTSAAAPAPSAQPPRPTWRAAEVLVTRGTRLSADGLQGAGGEVRVGATCRAELFGEVGVRGLHGRGGEVELSAAGSLRYGGRIDAGGQTGSGHVLLDPQDLIIDDAAALLAQYELVDPNDDAGGVFGQDLTVLPNGNVVVSDELDDFLGTDSGAAYLFDGTTGALISTLLGFKASCFVGREIVALTNGNYVVVSPLASTAFTSAGTGVVTWCDGTTGIGTSGTASATNSLTRFNDGDTFGTAVVPLATGNYVLVASRYGDGTDTLLGAVAWASGTAASAGFVGSTNALVGSTAGDQVGWLAGDPSVIALSNGNYVVISSGWDNGAVVDAGAVTWCDGSTGRTGTIDATNSLTSDTGGSATGSSGVVELANGHYVVMSQAWCSASADSVGAVTWGSGTGGVSGLISSSNSLVGTTTLDLVGLVTPLPNGNYVVYSDTWASNRGAVTWAAGDGSTTGAVDATNSLVGATPGDRIGLAGVIALTGGDYVISSQIWDGGRGAVTWVDGSAPTAGTVSEANSLVGTNGGDVVGSGGVVALANGHYVVVSPSWDGGDTNLGAITWCDGTQATVDEVDATNSLVGSSSMDQIGSKGVVALGNGSYVVASPGWDAGAASDAGAVTWHGGTGPAPTGPLSAANSLVGAQANDQVGSGGVTALATDHYVVASPLWDLGPTPDAGAATWGDGAAGTVGAVSAANSLVGSQTDDGVGQLVVALSTGDYVVASPEWDSGAVADAGAATWGDGEGGTTGPVDLANSLIGAAAGDLVGVSGVRDLANGCYAVLSASFGASDEGAVSLGRASGGTTGIVSAANGLLGVGALAALLEVAPVDGGLVASFANQRLAVALRLGSSAYDLAAGQSITAPTARVVELLSAGTDVTLQASRDLVIRSPLAVDNPSGTGGTLTLSAGRSVRIEADVTTDGGDLIAIANDALANGVVDADRSAGDAQVANTATIDAGTGTVRFETREGAGLTEADRTDYVLGTITAGTTVVVPFVDSLAPTTAALTATIVTIQGGGLSAATVTVGGVAAIVSNVAGDEVQFTVAATTPTGTQPVVVTTPSGSVGAGDLDVEPLADLAVTKTVDEPTPDEGATIVYTVTVTNQGPSASTGVALTDLLPAGVQLVSTSISHGTYDPGTGLWTIGALAASDSATLDLTCTVDAGTAGTTITNTTSGLAGSDLGGDLTDDAASVGIQPRLADLAVTKSVDEPTPTEGEAVVYTLTVTNQGPSAAGGVALTDALPAGVTFVSATPSQGTYDAPSGLWSVGTLANGAAATLTLTCTVDAGTAGTPITNSTSGLTADGLGGDPADDTGSVAITPQLADLAVTKTVDEPTPEEGEAVVYTVTVTNQGPSAADGVALTDALPAGVTFASVAASQGSYDAPSGLWSVGTLANGAAATLALTCTVDAGTAGTTITNATSGLTADGLGGDPADDTGSVAITPQVADLAVTKTVDEPEPLEGATVVYTVTVTNQGPGAAGGVALSDALPAGVTFVSAATSQGTYDPASGLWSVGNLANGASATLTLTCTVDADTGETTIVSSTSGLTADTLGGDARDDVGSVTITPQSAGGSSSSKCSLAAPHRASAATDALPLALLALLLAGLRVGGRRRY